jgi:hypothetical protein
VETVMKHLGRELVQIPFGKLGFWWCKVRVSAEAFHCVCKQLNVHRKHSSLARKSWCQSRVVSRFLTCLRASCSLTLLNASSQHQRHVSFSEQNFQKRSKSGWCISNWESKHSNAELASNGHSVSPVC